MVVAKAVSSDLEDVFVIGLNSLDVRSRLVHGTFFSLNHTTCPHLPKGWRIDIIFGKTNEEILATLVQSKGQLRLNGIEEGVIDYEEPPQVEHDDWPRES